MSNINLKYTLCFVKNDDSILLLKRRKPPWQEFWNGLGGKIYPNEKPLESAIREMKEETDITLNPEKVTFKGILTWLPSIEAQGSKEFEKYGTYLYIVQLPFDGFFWKGEKETREGELAWKSINWIMKDGNKKVALNIPHFLPHIIQDEDAREYFCNFTGNTFIDITILPLPNIK